MSNRRQQKKAAAVAAPVKTADSFQNFAAMVGVNTGNQQDASGYGFNPITRNRVQLEWMYRGSWVAAAAVDSVADDMTREGVEITSDVEPGDLKKLDKEIDRLQCWSALNSTIKWSRLYGGSLAFLMIDGQNPATPLNYDTIRKGQFKGLLPMDRYMVNPSMGNLIQEYGQNIGLPMFYTTVPDTSGMPLLKIHHSRMIRFEGVPLPYWQKISENLWGMSVLERLFDRLIAYDSATSGVGQLVYKAHLRTIKIEGLRQIISMGGPALAGLMANIDMIRSLQTNEGMTLLDSTDEFETHQYAFSGLDKILEQFAGQVAGALEIPRTRLFGESPSGLSNGEDGSGFRNYYDRVKNQQTSKLGAGVEKLYNVTWRGLNGSPPPEEFAITFKPLWQLGATEQADVVQKTTGAIVSAQTAQIISRATALKELKQMSMETGVFSNIEDEEINEAENDPAPSPEALGLEVPPPAPVAGPGAKAKAA